MNNVSAELHVLFDASQYGCSAVASAWRRPTDKSAYAVLAFTKSVAAPIKSVPIPGLRLSAAVLVVKVGEVKRRALITASQKARWLTLRWASVPSWLTGWVLSTNTSYDHNEDLSNP